MNSKLNLATATRPSCVALVSNTKSKTLRWIGALSVLATLTLPLPLVAQDGQDRKHEHHHYKVIDLGTFGGKYSQFSTPSSVGINNGGSAAGVADTSIPDPNFPNCFYDCAVDHAFMWKDGVMTDLGALPGGVSSFAYSVNNSGMIVGQSQNGLIDPLTGSPELRGALWWKGQISDLGTLGGNASNANAINDHGEVVGVATTGTPDPYANAPQSACQILPSGLCSGSTFAFGSLYTPSATETHAFRWHHGVMHDLGTLGGPDSAAWINNDRGDVTGWSSTSYVANPSTGVPSVDPFLWDAEDGTMRDLGTLGGTFGAPFFMNNRDQIVGISNLAGDLAAHPFIWSKSTGMTDLGTLGGTFGHPDWINDAGAVVGYCNNAEEVGRPFLWRNGVMTDLGGFAAGDGGEAESINSQDQVVGESGAPDGSVSHGFLWESEGPIVELDKLVLPGSGIAVVEAFIINDRGEIGAKGRLPNGDTHAILLIPCDENHPHINGCDYSLKE